MKSIPGFLLLNILLLTSFRAEAQQPEKIRRIGILFIGSQDQPHLTAFKQGCENVGTQKGRILFWNTAMPKADMIGSPNSLKS